MQWKILTKDIAKICIFLTVISFPFFVLLNNILWALSFLLIVVVYYQSNERNGINFDISILLMYFFVKVVIDSFYSFSENNLILEKSSAFIFFALFNSVYINTVYSKQNVSKIKTALIISAALASLILFSYHIYKILGEEILLENAFNWENVNVEYAKILRFHTTYIGLFILIAVILSLEKISKVKVNSKLYYIILLTIFFLSINLLFLSSRIILISYILLLVYFTISAIIKSKRYKLPKILGSIAFISVVVYFVYANVSVVKWRFKELSYNISEDDYSKVNYGGIKIRMIISECALHYIKDNFIFGINAFESKSKLIKCYKSKGFGLGEKMGYGTHNQYLNTLLNFGIIGFLLLSVVIYSRIYFSFKSNNRYGMIMIFVLLMTFLTENILEKQKGIFLFNLILIMTLPSNKFLYKKKQLHTID